MSKRTIIIILGVLILIAVGAVIFASRQRKEGFVSSVLEVGKPKESGGKSLTYEDESGFSFQYPSTLGVIEKDVNDPTVYSSLELSSKDHLGEKLVVKITDTSLATIDKWLKENPQTGNLANSAEIALGGMSGKNLKYANPSRTLILAVDNGILYRLEASEDGSFWTQALKMVSETFQLTGGIKTSNNGGGSVVDEGEETVE